MGKFNGICGLGLVASLTMVFPLISNLSCPLVLQAKTFAFYLGTGGTGDLVIGGADPAHYTEEFRHLPVLNQSLAERDHSEQRLCEQVAASMRELDALDARELS